ncbi:sigma-70 family RNA polymerase sigma factor, partial [Xanthomonas sp. Kuri4-3]
MAVPVPPAKSPPLAAELESHYEELHRYAARKYASAADDLVQDAWLRLASRPAAG